jgi:hypothetical protein
MMIAVAQTALRPDPRSLAQRASREQLNGVDGEAGGSTS